VGPTSYNPKFGSISRCGSFGYSGLKPGATRSGLGREFSDPNGALFEISDNNEILILVFHFKGLSLYWCYYVMTNNSALCEKYLSIYLKYLDWMRDAMRKTYPHLSHLQRDAIRIHRIVSYLDADAIRWCFRI